VSGQAFSSERGDGKPFTVEVGCEGAVHWFRYANEVYTDYERMVLIIRGAEPAIFRVWAYWRRH
jgi:hypothetical protein